MSWGQQWIRLITLCSTGETCNHKPSHAMPCASPLRPPVRLPMLRVGLMPALRSGCWQSSVQKMLWTDWGSKLIFSGGESASSKTANCYQLYPARLAKQKFANCIVHCAPILCLGLQADHICFLRHTSADNDASKIGLDLLP